MHHQLVNQERTLSPVNLDTILSWWVFPRWVELSRKLHSWWCLSVNSFKFQPCDHTPPRTQWLNGFPSIPRRSNLCITPELELASFTVRTTTVSNHLRSPDSRSWSMKTQWTRPLTPPFVLRKYRNFTSRRAIPESLIPSVIRSLAGFEVPC